MKNNELEELKPVYIHEASSSANDEISLVDLALVLVRRKRLIGLILITFISIGIIFILSQKPTKTTVYKYETSIHIGSRTMMNKTVFLEPPSTLLSSIKYIHIPSILPKSDRKYSITASLLKNSGIIVLKTSSDKANDLAAIDLLTTISHQAIANHDKYYNAIKNSLKAINNTEDPTDIALQLASLKTSSTSAKPDELEITTVNTGKSPKLILAFSIISGLIMALLVAFFAEFVSKVKEKLN